MLYRKKNPKNQLILVGLIIISIVFTTVYYREPGEGPFHVLKRLTLSVISCMQTGTAIVFRPLMNGWYFIGDLVQTREENIKLKEKVSELKRKVETLELTEQENMRLKELMKVSARKNFKTVLANVIGYSPNEMEKVLIIDKGMNDGLKEKMPVMTSQGLVGQIIHLTGRASQIILVMDPKSGVAVEIMKEGVRGIVEGSAKGELKMNMVKKEANLKIGDGVFTSGLGGVYPRGLYVGTIKSVSNPPASLFKDVKIETSVDFYFLKQVVVIVSPLPPDISQLQ